MLTEEHAALIIQEAWRLFQLASIDRRLAQIARHREQIDDRLAELDARREHRDARRDAHGSHSSG